MSDFQSLTKLLTEFRDAREWSQFHNAKDLAIALNVEASELLEVFLWKESDVADKDRVAEELADVFAYALLLAEKYDLDVAGIVKKKVAQNGVKYPVDKAKGSAKKYDEL